MPQPDDLERELAREWNRDQLAVLGDQLQSIGDPRGELIAIDLAGRPEASEARRGELITAWLADLPVDPDRARADHGFLDIEVDHPEALERLLASRYVHQLRAITLAGAGEVIAEGIARFASHTLPLLDRLTIVHGGDIPRTQLVPAEYAAALVVATPRLTTLAVNGRRVFGQLVHPGVRTLVISGLDALASLSGRGPAMPAVRSLDFAFHRTSLLDHLPPPADQLIQGLAPAARLPSLVRLDLSRNEPGSDPPNHLGGQVDPFAWLRRTTLRTLTHLRLPSLRSETQLRDLEAARVRMPALVEVTLARAYTDSPEPPPGIAAPPRQPWPPRDQVHGRDALTFHLEGHPYGEDVDLTSAVRLMERTFDRLPEACRAAWTEVWTFLADLRWEQDDGTPVVMYLPTIVLQRALEPVDLEDARRWADLRDLLRQRSATLPDTVSVRRYWGW